MKMFRFNFYYTRKENFFNNNNAEQTKGLIGYLRGDFGKNGNEFYTSWFNKNEKLNKEPFKTEFDDVMKFLRERLLTDRASPTLTPRTASITTKRTSPVFLTS